ncbi:hypothetical protein [Rhizobium oryzicola]|uniref:Cell envelope biogenesis protein TolA n=1 Tax=Rhizobium oryzicola TaxID=1232668 RepID=A0ABT8SUD5_9HYPH|nr:hypothetical protein [Rhizobium oryzicola]MDO1582059.1 hypothetical protein [Rhizobium oryzicola]
MRGSLGTSLVLHFLVLTAALLSLSAPAPFEVTPEESVSVDIVQSITQTQKGEEKAPKNEKPSPKPTKNQKVVENAENSGENDVDLKSPPTPAKKPVQTETAAAPPKAEPVPTPTPETNKVKDIVKEETAPKPEEVAALPIPKPEMVPTPKPEPQPEPKPQEQKTEDAPVPDAIPLPASRPKPEPPKEEAKPVEKPVEKPPEKKPETKPAEKTPDNKKVADKKQETAKSQAVKESEFNADQISAMLNKQEAAGGGAKRSTETASLGAKKTLGTGLSASEVDAVKGQIQGNWSLVAGLTGVEQVRVKIKVQLDKSGNIIGTPEVTATGGPDATRRAVESSTRRALLKSAPLKNLPVDKYDGEKGWNTLVLNFDPTEFAL